MQTERTFLMLNKKLRAFADYTYESEDGYEWDPYALGVLLYLYKETHKWHGCEYGIAKTTVREISNALGASGTSAQFNAIRYVLKTFQDHNFIQNENGKDLIEDYAMKPNDLLTLRFQKSVFTEMKGPFARAFAVDIEKLFNAKNLIVMERNSMVNLTPCAS